MNVAIATSDLHHHHQPKCNGRLCMKQQQQQVLGAPRRCCGIEEREWLFNFNFNLIFSEWFYVFL
jgi:hypothetical protein